MEKRLNNEDIIQIMLDNANIIDYTGRKIKKRSKRVTKEDIPDFLIDSCKRIATILSECAKEEISIEIAYDLWNIHSQESFCGRFECIDGVSDNVILHNILGLLEVLEFED